MLVEDFLRAFKSTIDKLGMDLGNSLAPSIGLIDLDNTVKAQVMFDSPDDFLVWELLTFDDTPGDPLYSASFNIGARTVNDPYNYDILSLTGKVKAKFPLGAGIEIYDYSGAIASSKGGMLTPVNVAVMPQQYEKVSGIRMITVTVKAQRFM